MVQNFLDCDPSIMVRNLCLKKEEEQPLDFTSQLLNATHDSPDRVRSISVTPTPGFCLKGRKDDGEKVFINICHCYELPEGEPISEKDLDEIINLQKEYVFPISVGQLHYETNKNGEIVSVFDVALNTSFYERVTSNENLRSFVAQMVFSAVQQKFNFNIPPEERSILKRRTFFGTIKPQLIEQRPVKKIPKRLIEDLGDLPSPSSKVTPEMVEALKAEPQTHPKVQRGLQLKEEIEGDKAFVVGYLNVDARSAAEISLHVGEDRLILQNKSRTLLDFFIKAKLNPNEATALFNTREKMLKIKVAIKG